MKRSAICQLSAGGIILMLLVPALISASPAGGEPSPRLSASGTPLLPTPLPSPSPGSFSTPGPGAGPTPPSPIVIEGDSVRYLRGGELIKGKGNIRIQYQGITLAADQVTFYVQRKEAYAEGNVRLDWKGSYFTTEKLRFDFIKQKILLVPASGYFAPFYGKAEEVQADKPANEALFREGAVTTCDLEKPHYCLQAKKIYLYPDDKLVAYNMVFYVYDLPLLWIPYYWRSLKENCQGSFLYPGWKSSWGFFFLSGYHLCLPSLHLTPHLDYRYRNGWAYGLDGRFRLGGNGRGEWQSYYLKDENFETDDGSTEKERYLTDFNYSHELPWRMRGLLSAHYYSDASVRRDFFRREYESDSQPSSFAYLVRSALNYTLSLKLEPKLNTFYKVTEKLPELKLDTSEIALGQSGFYYQGSDSYTNFRKLYQGETSPRYKSERLDSYHRFSYSRKLFGWLNINPGVSLRETYYSRGPGQAEAVAGTTPAVSPATSPSPTPEPADRKNIWRRVFSLNLGLSTNIYGVFPAENEWLEIHKLRHVIEPYLNYYFTDNPTVSPDDLYHFDWIDKIDRANYTRVGIRNLLQTKRLWRGDESSWSLLELDLYTNLYTKPDRDNYGHAISDLIGELDITPFRWLGMNLDMTYDTYEKSVKKTTLDAWVRDGDRWSTGLNYSYREDKNRDRLGGNVYFRLSPLWAFKVYGRYDLYNEEWEEESITIFRNLHCWDSYLTWRRLEGTNEDQIMLVFWIKAFPQSPLHLSN